MAKLLLPLGLYSNAKSASGKVIGKKNGLLPKYFSQNI